MENNVWSVVTSFWKLKKPIMVKAPLAPIGVSFIPSPTIWPAAGGLEPMLLWS